jgi:hypothetical protein
MTSQLQQLLKEGHNADEMLQRLLQEGLHASGLLQQVLEQICGVDKRICDLEAITRSNGRPPTSSKSTDPDREPGQTLSTLAHMLYGQQSPLIGFVLVLEDLADFSTFDYPLLTRKEWVKFTYSEDPIHLHELDCMADEPVVVSRQCVDLRFVSNLIFDALYEIPRYSGPKTLQAEEVVSLATEHIKKLQEWKYYLPASSQWKDEDDPSLDIHVSKLCKDYLKQHSMALLPYLSVAKDLKIVHQSAQKAKLGDSRRKLVEIASKCIHSAFQCAKLSSRVSPPRKVSCRGCQYSIDYAIHE